MTTSPKKHEQHHATAQGVLDKYWKDQGLPIDVEKIAGAANIAVLYDPSLGSKSGTYTEATDGSSPLIKVNPFKAKVHQRFTIAHELGHHFSNHGNCNRDLSEAPRDTNEVVANNFAAELLMPANEVHAAIRVRGVSSVAELAKLFNVSTQAMKIRLERLGYQIG